MIQNLSASRWSHLFLVGFAVMATSLSLIYCSLFPALDDIPFMISKKSTSTTRDEVSWKVIITNNHDDHYK